MATDFQILFPVSDFIPCFLNIKNMLKYLCYANCVLFLETNEKGMVILMESKIPKQLKIVRGNPFPLGVSTCKHGYQIAVVLERIDSCGVVFYDSNYKELFRVPFCEEYLTGNVASMVLHGLDFSTCYYQLYQNDCLYFDPYAKEIRELPKFIPSIDTLCAPKNKKALSFHETILYCLHVKGFTKDPSAKVKYPGTFLGITEKMKYLKELGITTIELMPCNEFSESNLTSLKEPLTIEQAIASYHLPMNQPLYSNYKPLEQKVNYWGFKKGSYFSPKYSYSATKRPAEEFLDMVNILHANGFEIVLQFYFEKGENQTFIQDVIRHWVFTYHIDGVHLKGEDLPITLLATDPLLKHIKFFYEYFPVEEIYGRRTSNFQKNLCVYHDQFMETSRKFLKGDEEIVADFMNLYIENPDYVGMVKFVSNYYGFTLKDMVTYQRKHNEANGEDNLDGTDYNNSYNYGIEGETNKKSINRLRKKQIVNALLFLFTSQGVPLLYSGDEFLRTQNGNNNPYCQDNEISWIQWDLKTKNKEFFQFVKWIIDFRKNNPIFSLEKRPRQMDYKAYGYPDVSFHGEEAWILKLYPQSKHFAVLYSNYYVSDKMQDDFIFILINMDLTSKLFQLPRLPKGYFYFEILNTDNSMKPQEQMSEVNQVQVKEYLVNPQSIIILKGINQKKEIYA